MLANIEITEKELEESKKSHNNQGKESYIKYISQTSKVRKIFRENFGYDNLEVAKNSELIETIRENKLRKVIELSKIKSFQNEIKVLATISCNGKFIGYDMVNPEGIPLADCLLTRKEVVFYFSKIEEQIEYFHSLGIVIGDITWHNTLLDKERKIPIFCDLDNMQVGKYPIDIFPVMLGPFRSGTCLISETADKYMHNLMLLEELDSYYDGYQEIERALKDGYRPSYLEKSANKVIRSMIETSIKGYYQDDYLTKYVKVKK